MHISAVADKCPRCGKTLDFHFFGLNSLLGSPMTVCRWCRSEVTSGRTEWPHMPILQRLWFFLVSSLYVGIVGFLGGYNVVIANVLFFKLPFDWDRHPDFLSPPFVTGFAAWGGLTLLLQGYRLFASIHRSNVLPSEPSRGFWNLQTWVQAKCLLLLMISPLVVWLVRAILDMLSGN